jgi:hypothetical protein
MVVGGGVGVWRGGGEEFRAYRAGDGGRTQGWGRGVQAGGGVVDVSELHQCRSKLPSLVRCWMQLT